MRFRRLWGDHMLYQTSWTRPISKPVRLFPRYISIHTLIFTTELDALALEEEESPSYLADLNKAPDFIDEPPAELAELSSPQPQEAVRTTA